MIYIPNLSRCPWQIWSQSVKLWNGATPQISSPWNSAAVLFHTPFKILLDLKWILNTSIMRRYCYPLHLNSQLADFWLGNFLVQYVSKLEIHNFSWNSSNLFCFVQITRMTLQATRSCCTSGKIGTRIQEETIAITNVHDYHLVSAFWVHLAVLPC